MYTTIKGSQPGLPLQDVRMTRNYTTAPTVLVTAAHSTAGSNVDPVHNGISAWVEVCWSIHISVIKELILLHCLVTVIGPQADSEVIAFVHVVLIGSLIFI